jgi:inosine-uridine nucleoside N-ribohydrolase
LKPTLVPNKELAQLEALHGLESDVIFKLSDFYLTSKRAVTSAVYDPLSVATVIDPTLVTLKQIHEMWKQKEEFMLGKTVANRMGSNENNALRDHYEIEGVIKLKPNRKVCLASDRERVLELFISRIQGK